MGRVLKWLIGIFVAVIVVTGVSVGILLALIDQEQIKTQLATVAHQQTGGKLAIDGDLGLSVFPQLGVSVGDVQFTPRDEKAALANVGTLRLGVALMPLFKGQIDVGEITLSGVRLQLVKDKNGQGNWEKIAPLETSAPETESAEPKGESSGGMNLAISSLKIADTHIDYRDLKAGTRYQLADFSLQSSQVSLAGTPFPVEMGFTINGSSPQISVAFELDTMLAGNLETQQFQLRELLSTIAISGEPTNGETISTRLMTDATIDLTAGTASLDSLRAELASLIIAGSVDISQLNSEPQVIANLASEPFNPLQLLEQLGQQTPEFANKGALQTASFSTRIDASTTSAQLGELDIKLDNSTLTGSVAVTNFDKQALVAKLNLDKINLDAYQMAGAEGEATEKPPATAKKSNKSTANTGQAAAELLPVETLRTLDLDASVGIGKLQAAGAQLTNVEMLLTAKNGVVDLRKLKANLYKGHTLVNGSIDARPKQPAWNLNAGINNVHMGPMLRDTTEIDWVEGLLKFNGVLKTQGNDMLALKKNLRGPAKFSLSNGVLREMNLEKTVCQAIAVINKKPMGKSWGPDTQLNNIEGALQFGGGKMVNKSFIAGLSNTDVKGSGEVNLINSNVDYQLGIRIMGTMREVEPACEVNKRYKDIYWPLRCKGNLSDEPSKLCGVDDAAINDIAAKMLTQEVKDRAGDDLEKKAKDELKRFLDRL